jgi:hypothetical protein
MMEAKRCEKDPAKKIISPGTEAKNFSGGEK